jgi:hypothetical protein
MAVMLVMFMNLINFRKLIFHLMIVDKFLFRPPEYPCTPPPSPMMSRSTSQEKLSYGDALVHINILLVDKKSPEYAQKYNKVGQFSFTFMQNYRYRFPIWRI